MKDGEKELLRRKQDETFGTITNEHDSQPLHYTE